MNDRGFRKRLEDLLSPETVAPEPIPCGPVVLYGAGAKGRETLSILRALGIDVAAFIDRTASGRVDGIAIRRPDDEALAVLAHDGCPVVVTVFNPGVDPLPIHDSLKAIGFRQIIGMVEARQRLAAHDAFWLSTATNMTPPAADAEWLFKKLVDDLSRETMLEVIALRRSWDPRLLRSPTPHDQYCAVGVPLPSRDVRFVDGGAFDGDTIGQLMTAGFVFEAIAAFEPDPVNYRTLTARLMKTHPCHDVSVWPCGLDWPAAASPPMETTRSRQ
jgi:hypothetical protein